MRGPVERSAEYQLGYAKDEFERHRGRTGDTSNTHGPH